MTMSEVGRAGQLVDPVNGGDVAADGTLLSVAEIQQRFREERARRGLAATPPTAVARPAAATPPPSAAPDDTASHDRAVETPVPPASVESFPPPAAPRTVNVSTKTPAPEAPAAPHPSGSTSESRGLDMPASWVRVLAGHSGAGASTTALCITDAAAAAGQRSQIIESAPASRSGLVSAASRELDVDETGAWRRGTRPHPVSSAHVTITRRTEDRQPAGWPATESTNPADLLVALDLGLVPTDALASVVGGPIVVACRSTVPGVRLTEQLLDRLADPGVVVAMLGGRRWPGEVTASCGPRLRALRDAGRVVTVPLDGHLAVTGPTHVPLPKAVLAAGRTLLGLIEAARSGGVSAPPNPAQSAPRQKGTTR